MLDLSRYRGPVVVLLALSTVAWAINYLLGVAVGNPGRLLPDGEKPTDMAVLDRVGSQVAAVAEQAEGGATGPPAPLAVFLGQSTAKDGLDPKVLDACFHGSLRWLGLCGSGGSILKIAQLARPFFASHLRPTAVVLVVGPEMLVGVPNPPADSPPSWGDVLRAVTGRQFGVLKQTVVGRVWVVQNRFLLNQSFRGLLFAARTTLFEGIRLDVGSWSSPAADPWEVTPHEAPFRRSPEELRKQAEGYLQFGWFDADRYSTRSVNARTLVGLIERSRAMSPHVVVLVMPAKSSFRALVPGVARRRLAEVVALAPGGRSVPIIDLWDQLPDEMFRDHLHVNSNGREHASRLFGRKMVEVLKR
jgi:hypothetical protein